MSKYRVILNKSHVYPLLLNGYSIVMVDLERKIIRDLSASTFPVIQSHIESEYAFFFFSVKQGLSVEQFESCYLWASVEKPKPKGESDGSWPES